MRCGIGIKISLEMAFRGDLKAMRRALSDAMAYHLSYSIKEDAPVTFGILPLLIKLAGALLLKPSKELDWLLNRALSLAQVEKCDGSNRGEKRRWSCNYPFIDSLPYRFDLRTLSLYYYSEGEWRALTLLPELLNDPFYRKLIDKNGGKSKLIPLSAGRLQESYSKVVIDLQPSSKCQSSHSGGLNSPLTFSREREGEWEVYCPHLKEKIGKIYPTLLDQNIECWKKVEPAPFSMRIIATYSLRKDREFALDEESLRLLELKSGLLWIDPHSLPYPWLKRLLSIGLVIECWGGEEQISQIAIVNWGLRFYEEEKKLYSEEFPGFYLTDPEELSYLTSELCTIALQNKKGERKLLLSLQKIVSHWEEVEGSYRKVLRHEIDEENCLKTYSLFTLEGNKGWRGCSAGSEWALLQLYAAMWLYEEAWDVFQRIAASGFSIKGNERVIQKIILLLKSEMNVRAKLLMLHLLLFLRRGVLTYPQEFRRQHFIDPEILFELYRYFILEREKAPYSLSKEEGWLFIQWMREMKIENSKELTSSFLKNPFSPILHTINRFWTQRSWSYLTEGIIEEVVEELFCHCHTSFEEGEPERLFTDEQKPIFQLLFLKDSGGEKSRLTAIAIDRFDSAELHALLESDRSSQAPFEERKRQLFLYDIASSNVIAQGKNSLSKEEIAALKRDPQFLELIVEARMLDRQSFAQNEDEEQRVLAKKAQLVGEKTFSKFFRKTCQR